MTDEQILDLLNKKAIQYPDFGLVFTVHPLSGAHTVYYSKLTFRCNVCFAKAEIREGIDCLFRQRILQVVDEISKCLRKAKQEN